MRRRRGRAGGLWISWPVAIGLFLGQAALGSDGVVAQAPGATVGLAATVATPATPPAGASEVAGAVVPPAPPLPPASAAKPPGPWSDPAGLLAARSRLRAILGPAADPKASPNRDQLLAAARLYQQALQPAIRAVDERYGTELNDAATVGWEGFRVGLVASRWLPRYVLLAVDLGLAQGVSYLLEWAATAPDPEAASAGLAAAQQLAQAVSPGLLGMASELTSQVEAGLRAVRWGWEGEANAPAVARLLVERTFARAAFAGFARSLRRLLDEPDGATGWQIEAHLYYQLLRAEVRRGSAEAAAVVEKALVGDPLAMSPDGLLRLVARGVLAGVEAALDQTVAAWESPDRDVAAWRSFLTFQILGDDLALRLSPATFQKAQRLYQMFMEAVAARDRTRVSGLVDRLRTEVLWPYRRTL